MKEIKICISAKDIEDLRLQMVRDCLLVSVDEASEILSCSNRKVYDLVREGALEGYNANPGRRGLRIRLCDLRDYVVSIKVDKDFWRE